ncbi:mitogen-activated protein kinase kinase STE7 SCDLUD_000243 [Saccharomycodes ludwigii]|uniref:mitogen-activated protein kinase kinase STE7 n=1 Tax=Saccharomycodes ludwigii TaxID=36035 RepID=UPI001E89CAE6|nr:hypothetical protein SCDLUD_000243 [Saccharomycodes ludwigii]KAH3902661.1 hypothetical protein SCDLUD_000243 [Saccharomycodes ludwigii]
MNLDINRQNLFTTKSFTRANHKNLSLKDNVSNRNVETSKQDSIDENNNNETIHNHAINPGLFRSAKPLIRKSLKRNKKPTLQLGESNAKKNIFACVPTNTTIDEINHTNRNDTHSFTRKKDNVSSDSTTNTNKKNFKLPPSPVHAREPSISGMNSLADDFDKLSVFNNDNNNIVTQGATIQLDDLVQLGKIGSGNSGTVLKVLHVPNSKIIAKKIIPIENNLPQVKQQLIRELTIMQKIGKHNNIVEFYSAFYNTVTTSQTKLVTPLSTTTNIAGDDEDYVNKYKSPNESQISNYNADDKVDGREDDDHDDEDNAVMSNEIIICMEYMNLGSLDKILSTYKRYCRRNGVPISQQTSWFNNDLVISKISFGVLNGLNFLYTNYKIIHRDIKPSNILLNSKGYVKICDFGVSKKLIDSIADTFVGTSTYMSPERIQGGVYTTKGDIWSLGLMIIELLTGEFPLGGHNDTPEGILDLLQKIVNEASPKLPNPSTYTKELNDLVKRCCVKDEKERSSLQELLYHDFITKYSNSPEYDREFRHWCKKIKKLMQEEKTVRREEMERAKLQKLQQQNQLP